MTRLVPSRQAGCLDCACEIWFTHGDDARDRSPYRNRRVVFRAWFSGRGWRVRSHQRDMLAAAESLAAMAMRPDGKGN